MTPTLEVGPNTRLTMAWRLVGPIFVIAHSTKEPSDADYRSALDGYAKHLGMFNGILVSTMGAGPNFAQRKRTTEFWQGKIMPTTVVMTSSRLARGIITAMNWFLSDSPIIATAFGDFPTAFDCLAVPEALRPELRAAIQELHGSLIA